MGIEAQVEASERLPRLLTSSLIFASPERVPLLKYVSISRTSNGR